MAMRGHYWQCRDKEDWVAERWVDLNLELRFYGVLAMNWCSFKAMIAIDESLIGIEGEGKGKIVSDLEEMAIKIDLICGRGGRWRRTSQQLWELLGMVEVTEMATGVARTLL
ncbi:hypothetical protein GW17_00040835 [Ensete ventricosum]|nr:hypothetical protein GW17_00040835 [Ensete ventricosum]